MFSATASWQVFHNNINNYQLYSSEDPNVETLLRDLSTLPINHMSKLVKKSILNTNSVTLFEIRSEKQYY